MIATFIDRDLLSLDRVWAAAGASSAVLCLRSSELERLIGGAIVSIG